jgi:hypothetical protein
MPTTHEPKGAESFELLLQEDVRKIEAIFVAKSKPFRRWASLPTGWCKLDDGSPDADADTARLPP